MFDLADRTALVCGSSRGIGRAAAAELARAGARVTLIARSQDALERARDDLPGDGHEVLTADFNEPDRVATVVQEHLELHGPIQILVNNTGGPPAGQVIDAGPDDFVVAFRRHLIASHLLSQLLIPGMRASGYGRIINIISTSVRQPIPGLGVSNTIRGAVASWAKTLSQELGPDGITVNNVLPGPTHTERLEQLIRGKAAAEGIEVEEVERQMEAEVPLRRFANPTEVAQAIAFLASPRAAFITGVSLPVDGGRIGCI